jgi:dienelactone hydrolase
MVGESEKEVRKLAAQIADDGYLVFIPHYLDPAPGSTTMPSRDVMVQRTIQANTYRPGVTAAVNYALKQPDADTTRLGIVGLSLGGGLALWYAQSVASGTVKAVVDFFGHIGDPSIYNNAGKLPPTLVFHNYKDQIVDPAMSENLIAELAKARVVHDKEIYREPPYPERFEHTFRPGGKADVDSRARTRQWLDSHVKP